MTTCSRCSHKLSTWYAYRPRCSSCRDLQVNMTRDPWCPDCKLYICPACTEAKRQAERQAEHERREQASQERRDRELREAREHELALARARQPRVVYVNSNRQCDFWARGYCKKGSSCRFGIAKVLKSIRVPFYFLRVIRDEWPESDIFYMQISDSSPIGLAGRDGITSVHSDFDRQSVVSRYCAQKLCCWTASCGKHKQTPSIEGG